MKNYKMIFSWLRHVFHLTGFGWPSREVTIITLLVMLFMLAPLPKRLTELRKYSITLSLGAVLTYTLLVPYVAWPWNALQEGFFPTYSEWPWPAIFDKVARTWLIITIGVVSGYIILGVYHQTNQFVRNIIEVCQPCKRQNSNVEYTHANNGLDSQRSMHVVHRAATRTKASLAFVRTAPNAWSWARYSSPTWWASLIALPPQVAS